MNNLLRQILVTLLIISSFSCSDKREKLLVSGCGWKQVSIIDKASGKIEWTHPLSKGEDCNDAEITSEGNILYAYRQGTRLIDRNHHVIWDFKAKPKEEVYTSTQLTDGTYLIAMCGLPSRIIELDQHGRLIKELILETSIQHIHSQFRQIQKTKNDTYIIPLMGKSEVIEINNQLNIIRKVHCSGTPYSVLTLPNGNWLISCGDGHSLEEINPATNKIVRNITTEKLRGVKLYFTAEAIRYKNGNILFCNWNGHVKDKSQPLLVETDSLNQIIWQLPSDPQIVNISTVCSFFE